jgi:hypothetical protein
MNTFLIIFIGYIWICNSILLRHLYEKNIPEYKREYYHIILIIAWPFILPFLLRHILFLKK